MRQNAGASESPEATVAAVHKWNARKRRTLKKEHILDALRHFSFSHITMGKDEPRHPNGPAFMLIARKG